MLISILLSYLTFYLKILKNTSYHRNILTNLHNLYLLFLKIFIFKYEFSIHQSNLLNYKKNTF